MKVDRYSRTVYDRVPEPPPHGKDFMLTSLVDPSAVIRKEYLNYTVKTTAGRVRSVSYDCPAISVTSFGRGASAAGQRWTTQPTKHTKIRLLRNTVSKDAGF